MEQSPQGFECILTMEEARVCTIWVRLASYLFKDDATPTSLTPLTETSVLTQTVVN